MASSTDLTPRELLELMLGHLGFVFELEENQQGERLTLNIRTRDPGRLIGRDGHTIEDLQFLLNRLLDHPEPGAHDTHGPRVIVDVEGYRQKEQEDFLDAIRERAERVKRTGQPERLQPMNAFERWSVHQAFQADPEVRTRSIELPGSKLKAISLEPR
jgi:spoIIIJ-associated protein